MVYKKRKEERKAERAKNKTIRLKRKEHKKELKGGRELRKDTREEGSLSDIQLGQMNRSGSRNKLVRCRLCKKEVKKKDTEKRYVEGCKNKTRVCMDCIGD